MVVNGSRLFLLHPEKMLKSPYSLAIFVRMGMASCNALATSASKDAASEMSERIEVRLSEVLIFMFRFRPEVIPKENSTARTTWTNCFWTEDGFS